MSLANLIFILLMIGIGMFFCYNSIDRIKPKDIGKLIVFILVYVLTACILIYASGLV